MELKDRIKNIRIEKKLTQREFSKKIHIAQATLAQFEMGERIPKGIHISAICSEFNVNEQWLRHGEGKPFISDEIFSLDAYAKEKNMSDLDLALIKSYLDMPHEMRNTFLNHIRLNFANKNNETAATTEPE